MMLYDSAEMDSKDAELLSAATVARDALRSAILGRIVRIDCGGFDKYGRLLVTVWKGKVNINKWMLDKGYGQPYRGAGQKYHL